MLGAMTPRQQSRVQVQVQGLTRVETMVETMVLPAVPAVPAVALRVAATACSRRRLRMREAACTS